MKKLGRLEINPENIMKKEDLLILRGGYEGCYECLNCEMEHIGAITGCCLTQYEAVAACQGMGYTMTCYSNECPCPCNP